MSAVLLTGATTPIGVETVRRLLARGSNVIAVGRASEAQLLPNDEPNLHFSSTDLTRRRSVHDLLFGLGKELDVRTVIHAAFHRSSVQAGRRAHALNVGATRELLTLSERHPTIERFVFFSHSDVYRLEPSRPNLLAEDHPLELSPSSPQVVRDRVEADLTVCTRMGMSALKILVLRLAEVLAPNTGSQLYDYLSSSVCLRPLGFDPMLNLLSVEDAATAFVTASEANANGIFNIPGADTLPLSCVIRRWGRRNIPVPGPLLAPLYKARASRRGMEFRYDMNYRRFHFSAVLDGARARDVLSYRPTSPIAWKRNA